MKKKFAIAIIVIAATLFFGYLQGWFSKQKNHELSVAISPYQDIAMIANASPLGLEEKYGTTLDLQTMNWENILPSLASSGKTVDIGFASLVEFLTKANNINNGVSDSLMFIYPAYIFKGGGFITFSADVPLINSANLTDKVTMEKFFSNKIGAQKNSIYEMMLYTLAMRNSINISKVSIVNTTLNDGILATQNGSLQIAAAGLTQITEAQKREGRVVLTMENMGFADITGFVCKQSVLKAKRKEIEDFLHMWYDCVDYVFKDLDTNSKHSLKYLDEKAATKYTLEQYKTALTQEYFPRKVVEATNSIIDPTGNYYYRKICGEVIAYLLENKVIDRAPIMPSFITIN